MKRKDLLNNIAFRYSTYKLRKSFRYTSLDDLYDFTKSFLGKGYFERISMHQFELEFKAFCYEVKSNSPRIIVEIGTKKGGSFFIWARYLRPTFLISIDLPGGIHGGGFPSQKIPFYKSFLSDDIEATVELIQGDSHSKETFENLKGILKGRQIDFLFIDGDHRYEGVKSDFEMYKSLMNKGGLIGFHDIVSSNYHHDMNCFVDKFWEEIKKDYKHKEFFSYEKQEKYGMGLIYV